MQMCSTLAVAPPRVQQRDTFRDTLRDGLKERARRAALISEKVSLASGPFSPARDVCALGWRLLILTRELNNQR